MKHIKLFRIIWFRNELERRWFTVQLVTHYAACRKAVVLYALKRLALIFRMPFSSLDGGNELVTLYDACRRSDKRHWWLSLLPMEFHRNPLQIISDDYSYAEDDFEIARKDSQAGIQELTPLKEHSTVADYVRLIVEYDAMCRQVDRQRVTSILGVTPP